MSTIRRAFVMASVEQYLALVINVTVVATMARLLTPEAVGLAVTATGIVAIALSLREFVTPEFLIQRPEIDEWDMRTSVTLLFAVTGLVAAGVMAAAGALSRFYSSPDLNVFLLLAILSALAEVISQPIIAVMRREMAFGILANIRTVALMVSAVTTITLAWQGFGYVSYGWGMLASAMTLAALASAVSTHSLASILRPSLASWREVAAFGRFKGASQAVDRIYESLPQLILGKIVSMSSVGLFNRANTICGIPDRIIMSAFYAMAFPALASSVREGQNIKQSYLSTLSYLSVLYWPGLLLIAITARPIVHVILGPQWDEAVHLVRILAVAAVFWFAVIVTNPLLLALGCNRDAFLSSLISRCLAAVAICTASTYGVTAMALSQFISLPVQMLIAFYFVRRNLHYGATELVSALIPSVVVTLFSIAFPLGMLAANDWQSDFNAFQFMTILLLAGISWMAGLFVARHPFLVEVRIIGQAALNIIVRARRHFPALGA
jgi:O-antigen/teichoic acid export membrane protein